MGRRKGLKIPQNLNFYAGSSPAQGIIRGKND